MIYSYDDLQEIDRLGRPSQVTPPAKSGSLLKQLARGAVYGGSMHFLRPFADQPHGGLPETLAEMGGSIAPAAALMPIAGAGVGMLGARVAAGALRPALQFAGANVLQNVGEQVGEKVSGGPEQSFGERALRTGTAGAFGFGLGGAMGRFGGGARKLAQEAAVKAEAAKMGLGGAAKAGAEGAESAVAPPGGPIGEQAEMPFMGPFRPKSGVAEPGGMPSGGGGPEDWYRPGGATQSDLPFVMTGGKLDKFGRQVKTGVSYTSPLSDATEVAEPGLLGRMSFQPKPSREPFDSSELLAGMPMQPKPGRPGFPAPESGVADLEGMVAPPISSPPPLAGQLAAARGAIDPAIKQLTSGIEGALPKWQVEQLVGRMSPDEVSSIWASLGRDTNVSPAQAQAELSELLFSGQGRIMPVMSEFGEPASRVPDLAKAVAKIRNQYQLPNPDIDQQLLQAGVDALRAGKGGTLPPSVSLMARVADDIPFPEMGLYCLFGAAG